MATRKVTVERYVEQVRDGSHYKGYVKIADIRLDFELVFGVPIAQLDSVGQLKDENEIRRIFQITVKRDSANIELTKEEYDFFFSMIVEMAVEFYHNGQTCDSNEGFMGMAIRGEGPMAGIVKNVSIGMTSSGSYNFQPELCEMLSSSKFGCALAA